MKRDPGLQPLSRDHLRALLVSRTLRKADASGREDAIATFRKFWADDAQRHFREEEEILLPCYAGYGNAEDPAVVRVLVEHVMIRARAIEIERTDPSLESLHELGDLLERHVRHEERVLFPMVEQALPPERLAELAQALGDGELP